MSDAMLLKEAGDKVKARVAECNKLARDLIGEASAFTKRTPGELAAANPEAVKTLLDRLINTHMQLLVDKLDYESLRARIA